MAKCVICESELSNNPFNMKDKYELLKHSFICKSCANKIGITNMWKASLYTPEKAKEKYYKLYPQQQSFDAAKQSVNSGIKQTSDWPKKKKVSAPLSNTSDAASLMPSEIEYESELEKRIATDAVFRKQYVKELRGCEVPPNDAFENLLATNTEFRRNHLEIRRSDVYIESTKCSEAPLDWSRWPNCIFLENTEPWEMTESIAAFFKRTANDKYYLTLYDFSYDKSWKILKSGGPVHNYLTSVEEALPELNLVKLLCQEYANIFSWARVRNIKEYFSLGNVKGLRHQILFINDFQMLANRISIWERDYYISVLTYLVKNAPKYGVYLIIASSLDLRKIPELSAVQNDFSVMSSNRFHSMCIGIENTNVSQLNTEINGYEFEEECAKLLEINNYYNIQITPKSGDQGIDILAEKDGIKFAIQCKCYSSPVGNKAVQEVFSGKSFYGCHVAIVMTNNTFTDSAKQLASQLGVVLWDGTHLVQMRNKR